MGQQNPTPCPFSNLNEAALEPHLKGVDKYLRFGFSKMKECASI